jgi:phosphoribosylformylglycinamidine cyclo-ligase
MSITYKNAGVDIEAGDKFAAFIQSIQSKAITKNLGGFAGGFEIDTTRYKHPIVMSTTDGVGTKLLVAKKLQIYDTVGIDLVAMCVNDLIVCGATPQSFLDYIACGMVNANVLQEIIKGVVKGCEEAECILTGGETAEMPDMYGPDDIDLAGFAIGVVEKTSLLPKKNKIHPGDKIIGLPSSGIHSNGFAVARKLVPETETDLRKELLTPTRIYVKEIKKLLETEQIKGAAHITGGGLESNIQRVLPDGLKPNLNYDWKVPEIFNVLQERGSIDDDEMRRIFNLGIGISILVAREDMETFMAFGDKNNIELEIIGEVKTI